MDNHRQAQLLRQLQLGVEHLLLEIAGWVFLPVVVQADLPDGPHLGMDGQGAERIQPAVLPGAAVGGVDPDGGVDMGKPLRQLHRRFGALQLTAGVEDQLHPPPGHGGQHLQLVGAEGPGVVMGVGIKQSHKQFLPVRPDRAPAGLFIMAGKRAANLQQAYRLSKCRFPA